MLFKTTKCSQHNHPEFHLLCETKSIPEEDVNWFIKHLENEVANGVIFKHGETIQIGCMVNKIELVDDNNYQIFEPDMNKMPIAFINSITNTLKFFRQQQDIVDSFSSNIAVSFPSIQESIIVSKNFESTSNFFLNREEKEAQQSGWFFRDITDNATEDYEQISLYEFACKRPDTVKYLGLPIGVGILQREGDKIRIVRDNLELGIIAGSYLAQINSAQQK